MKDSFCLCSPHTLFSSSERFWSSGGKRGTHLSPSVMAHFMCRLDWAVGCLGVQSNMTVGLSVGMFVDEISIRIHRLSREMRPPSPTWAGIIQSVKGSNRTKRWRKLELALRSAVWVGGRSSPALSAPGPPAFGRGLESTHRLSGSRASKFTAGFPASPARTQQIMDFPASVIARANSLLNLLT